MAILQLAQEGKIQLDDDIRKYVDIKTNNKTVTIDQLLHHTSGIKSHTDLKEFFQINKYDFPRDTLLRLVEENNFEFEPGTNYKYCDMGYQLLGRVIEKVSEKDYYSYMNSEVINKTQLKGTYFWDSEKVKPLEAYGYQKSATGVFEDASYINATGDFVHAPYINFKWPYAAGGLGSTVSDLLRWNQLIHHSEVLLSKKFYDLLVSPYSLLDGELTSYGCGLVIRELGGYKAYFHSGGTPGFRSWLGYYPELDLSIVLLSNTWTNLAFLPISLEMRNIVLEMLVTNDKLNKQTIVPANNRKEN